MYVDIASSQIRSVISLFNIISWRQVLVNKASRVKCHSFGLLCLFSMWDGYIVRNMHEYIKQPSLALKGYMRYSLSKFDVRGKSNITFKDGHAHAHQHTVSSLCNHWGIWLPSQSSSLIYSNVLGFPPTSCLGCSVKIWVGKKVIFGAQWPNVAKVQSKELDILTLWAKTVISRSFPAWRVRNPCYIRVY